MIGNTYLCFMGILLHLYDTLDPKLEFFLKYIRVSRSETCQMESQWTGILLHVFLLNLNFHKTGTVSMEKGPLGT